MRPCTTGRPRRDCVLALRTPRRCGIRRPGYRRHSDGWWYPLAAFGLGAAIGGAIANDRDTVDSHVSWCANRYRSYRAYDNTFQPNYGPRRACISPYSR